MPKNKTVLIMAGGTGGHVFPALATAERLRAHGFESEWLGTDRGIEARVVPEAGITLHTIDVFGVRGKGIKSLLLAPFQVARAIWQARAVIRQVEPCAVLGMGGFASGPGGIAAWLMRCPLVIHEQNAKPGTTNRLLARFAKRVMAGYPVTISGRDAEFVGNPVRREIAELPAPEQRWSERSGSLRLLVLGGSLGAKAINEAIPQILAAIPAEARPEVWHQAGAAHSEGVSADYLERGLTARVEPFIEQMEQAYAWADLVICRAGALTVAELTAAGVGAWLVPLPHAIDDHQTHNARWFADQGAGEVIPQYTLSVETLAERLAQLSSQREELLTWATAARALARNDAAERVAESCMEVAHV